MALRNTYSLPRIDECTESLRAAALLSTTDCGSGYYRVEISEKDRNRTTFCLLHGLTGLFLDAVRNEEDTDIVRMSSGHCTVST